MSYPVTLARRVYTNTKDVPYYVVTLQTTLPFAPTSDLQLNLKGQQVTLGPFESCLYDQKRGDFVLEECPLVFESEAEVKVRIELYRKEGWTVEKYSS